MVWEWFTGVQEHFTSQESRRVEIMICMMKTIMKIVPQLLFKKSLSSKALGYKSLVPNLWEIRTGDRRRQFVIQTFKTV